ncbi:MAG TPA: type VII secretion integral membrane protein EccD [Pseudonocardia sp.]|nr:type VII secretion integral membrane protein EccD [Pseudonocardia sp.]
MRPVLPSPPAYCRVTVLAPRSRVDVALPADVPMAELVPMVLELVGEPVPRPGGPPRRPGAWRLTGAAGGPLPSDATLGELGVLDGDMVRLDPGAPPPAAPVFDDPVDALAATADPLPAGARGRTWRRVALVVAVAAAALLAAARGWPADPGAAAATVAVVLGALGAVAALVGAARLLRAEARGPASAVELRAAARTATLAAVPPAAAAGWAALPGSPGAAHVLLAAAAAGTAAALGQCVLRRAEPALVAVLVVTATLAAGALLRLQLGADVRAIATGAGALALAAGPLLPRAALSLAGLPKPVVPTDAQDLIGADDADVLPPPELADRAALARAYLAGLVGGTGVVAAAAALPAAASGGWAGPVFGAVTVAVLLLRVCGYADATPARILLAAGTGAGVALAGLLGTVAGPVARLGTAAALVVVAAGALLVGAGPAPDISPVSRRAVDILENLLVAAAVPLALGAMGVYALVRGL